MKRLIRKESGKKNDAIEHLKQYIKDSDDGSDVMNVIYNGDQFPEGSAERKIFEKYLNIIGKVSNMLQNTNYWDEVVEGGNPEEMEDVYNLENSKTCGFWEAYLLPNKQEEVLESIKQQITESNFKELVWLQKKYKIRNSNNIQSLINKIRKEAYTSFSYSENLQHDVAYWFSKDLNNNNLNRAVL